MYRTSREWTIAYEKRGALWRHDGNPRRPHVAMTSGGHSDSFFNSGLAMQDPALLAEACSDLLKLAVRAGVDPKNINWVVGPAFGAITIAYELARRIFYLHERSCFSGYCEKVGEDPERRMIFTRVSFQPDEVVLPCEDVITSARSALLMTDAAKAQNASVLPFLLALVNRSGITNAGEMKIISLINHPLSDWQPEECPLCRDGSEAVRAKYDWHRLTAKM